jgi:hypothetical protein
MVFVPVMIVVGFGLAWGCNNPNQTLPTRGSTSQITGEENKKEDPLSNLPAQTPQITDNDLIEAYRSFQVDRFELDDPKFRVRKLVIGLKDFVGNPAPYLSYEIPKDGDFVEIMRCDQGAKINTGISTVSLEDIDLSDHSGSDAFRGSDFFRNAEEAGGCRLISPGHISNSFQDTFSPSGNHLYLVRVCVAKERLVSTEGLTSRACSRQIAISQKLSYENKRKQEEQDAWNKTHVYESEIDNIFWSLRILAEDMIQEMNRCEDREAKRAIKTKTKEAWLTVAATAGDVAIELVSYGKATPGRVLQHYTKLTNKGRAFDALQLINAAGGMSFRDLFINLAASTEDMPRSCGNLQAMQMQMQEKLTGISESFYNLAFYSQKAQTAAQGLDSLSTPP